MQYQIETEGKTSILTISGDLIGQHQVEEMTEEIVPLIEGGSIFFVVDMSEVRLLNSSGLTVLLTVLTQTRNAGGDTILANPSKQIENLLVTAKLYSIFTIAESREKAMELLCNLIEG